MGQSDEESRLLQSFDQMQNDIIDLSESFVKTVKKLKRNSHKYCAKHCPYSKSVYVRGHKVRGIICDGEKQWDISPCISYQKQNEFLELCFSLLDFLQYCIRQVKDERELKIS